MLILLRDYLHIRRYMLSPCRYVAADIFSSAFFRFCTYADYAFSLADAAFALPPLLFITLFFRDVLLFIAAFAFRAAMPCCHAHCTFHITCHAAYAVVYAAAIISLMMLPLLRHAAAAVSPCLRFSLLLMPLIFFAMLFRAFARAAAVLPYADDAAVIDIYAIAFSRCFLRFARC